MMWSWLIRKETLLLGAAIGLYGAGFITGRKTAKPVIVTETIEVEKIVVEEKVVEKVIKVKVKDTITKTKITESKDGTKVTEIVEEIKDKTETFSDSKKDTSSDIKKVSQSMPKVVSLSQYKISGYYSINDKSYVATVGYRLFKDLWIDAGYNQKTKSALVGFTYEF